MFRQRLEGLLLTCYPEGVRVFNRKGYGFSAGGSTDFQPEEV